MCALAAQCERLVIDVTADSCHDCHEVGSTCSIHFPHVANCIQRSDVFELQSIWQREKIISMRTIDRKKGIELLPMNPN